MEETRTDGGSASGGRPQKQYPERLGKGLHADSVGWTHSEDTDSSPSGATLKRLKLKVGGLATNTLHLTPGRPSSQSSCFGFLECAQCFPGPKPSKIFGGAEFADIHGF